MMRLQAWIEQITKITKCVKGIWCYNKFVALEAKLRTWERGPFRRPVFRVGGKRG